MVFLDNYYLFKENLMYTFKRLSGIRRKTQIIVNLIDSCVVLLDNKPTFDLRHTFVVALAKSQDHRVIYEVFCFWRPYSTRKQRICMDGLEQNTVHRYIPVKNSTELDLGISNLISTWWNKTYEQANKSLMGTWVSFVIFKDKQLILEKVGSIHPWQSFD